MQIVNNAIWMFRREEFFYTLEPGELNGPHLVDEFLFESRRGFCEHYAGAFVVLMRAAGLPARVVTGYQGATFNEAGGYHLILQSDAHAWAEVWIQGRGWLRIDPTGAVAPMRIESGLTAALSPAERASIPFALRNAGGALYQLRMRWDWVNATWNRLVLAYGPDLQQEFLSRFGIGSWYRMTLVLTAVLVAFLSVLGVYLLWQARPAAAADPVLREWRRFCSRLARKDLRRQAHEGPRDFARRAGQARPDLATDIGAIADLYIGLRYRADPEPARVRVFAQKVRRFRP
jgi:hypothetical protein